MLETFTRWSHRRRTLAATLLLLATLAAVPPTAVAAYTPQNGDFFAYHMERTVGDGGGEYAGYSDRLVSDGLYTVTGVNSSGVTLRTKYDWSYTSNEGGRQSGHQDRIVSFSLADRRYTSATTDYDELDGRPASGFTPWFWVSPDVQVGDPIQVLDAHLNVVSRDATIWLGMSPKHAIMIEGTGSGSRNDIYGAFSFTWKDTYYFDIGTGWFLAERYTERDIGTWHGEPASFTWTEQLDFVRGSYAPAVDAVALYGFWGMVGLSFALIGAAAYAYKQRPLRLQVQDVGTVRVSELKDVGRLAGALPLGSSATSTRGPAGPMPVSGVTEVFGHFLVDFATKARASKDRVAWATSGERVAGLALYNEEGQVGTVFAKSTGLAEALRERVKAKDFFSEWRHGVSSESREAALEMGATIGSNDAYNLLDTYSVLVSSRFPATGYDASLVLRMQPQDMGAVADIAKRVFKTDSDRWLKAQVAAGDIGFVARVEGRIVGFALASSVGHAGRLHTLAVLPEFRTRGIGRELVRARLQALEALGATYVIAEVARWNVPALDLLYAHGFEKRGEMFVETARTSRPNRDFVRR